MKFKVGDRVQLTGTVKSIPANSPSVMNIKFDGGTQFYNAVERACMERATVLERPLQVGDIIKNYSGVRFKVLYVDDGGLYVEDTKNGYRHSIYQSTFRKSYMKVED